MKKLVTFSVITLNVLSLFSESESMIIPLLIYAGVKDGWFTKSSSSYERQVEATTRNTTTIATGTTESPYSVEYMFPSMLNPCGYGPSPAFHFRIKSFSDLNQNVPHVPEEQRYIYSLYDVGEGDLGIFLLRSLQAMKTPNFYSKIAFFTNEKLKYNHYKIHRYLFNQLYIPLESSIYADFITDCTEDSTSLCPVPTISLCTSNGAILCVANYTSTASCNTLANLDCVNSKFLGYTWVEEEIPCISRAIVYGHIGFNLEKNTIVSNEKDEKMEGRVKQIRKKEREWKEYAENSGKQVIEDDLASTTSEEAAIISRRDLNPVGIENTFCVTIVAIPGRNHK